MVRKTEATEFLLFLSLCPICVTASAFCIGSLQLCKSFAAFCVPFSQILGLFLFLRAEATLSQVPERLLPFDVACLNWEMIILTQTLVFLHLD